MLFGNQKVGLGSAQGDAKEHLMEEETAKPDPWWNLKTNRLWARQVERPPKIDRGGKQTDEQNQSEDLPEDYFETQAEEKEKIQSRSLTCISLFQ